jgi:hypothetical protein
MVALYWRVRAMIAAKQQQCETIPYAQHAIEGYERLGMHTEADAVRAIVGMS